MFRKSVALILMASLLCTTFDKKVAAAPMTMQYIYAYVRQGQLFQLMPYLQNSPLLETEDQYGYTPLCYAIYNHDKVMVQKLIFLGANVNAYCMNYIPLTDLRSFGLTRRGVASDAYYSPNRRSMHMPSLLTRKNMFTLGLIGTVAGSAALIASISKGGGGSHSVPIIGGSPSKPETPSDETELEDTTTIPATKYPEQCPKGMSLINGVCTTPVTQGADGSVEIADISTQSPYYLAEFGGKLVNSGALSYMGSTSETIVGMQANGVSVSALSADGQTVQLNKAASVKNASDASITMLEDAADDLGIIAMYGTSAGTINNDGSINIVSKSHAESAAMLVDRNDAAGISGIGENITNNGRISVLDQGDGMGVLSAISAPGRGITNNGTIDIVLDTDGGTINENTKGTAHGIYGRNIVNKGTVTLSTNAAGANTAINTETYLLRGYGDMDSTIANDGVVNVDLTNIAWGIYGVWSDEAAESGVTVSNTGTINVSGTLYNDAQQYQAKHVYLLGAEGGISDIKNTGTINVGTTTVPIDVSMGGIMNAMYGFSGTMNNENKISFNLYADPSISSGAFSAYAMSLDRGNLVNDADVNYYFTNEKEGFEGTSNQIINLSAISTNTASVTNNANLTAVLQGSSADGSSYTGIKGGGLNTDLISAISNMDNMDLIGMSTSYGSVTNSENARISLRTTGNNADLKGSKIGSKDGTGLNSGYVYLNHDGGSGNIYGFDGGNQGVIQIEAHDMTGNSYISGGETFDAISEEGESSDVENTTDASGIINISLTGQTSGEVYGYEYNTGDENPSYVSANTINIKAESSTRSGDLSVYGLTANGAPLERNGTMTLKVWANPTYRTEVVGLSGNNSNLTNNAGSVVNLNVDLNGSTNHYIVGMESIDDHIYYDETTDMMRSKEYHEYVAQNNGTLNLNISGSGATDSSHYYEGIPFDVVGMLTNSVAINTGTINLNVDSLAAKTAGMVAYDGGMIINKGTISFTGNADNFVPMYATGHRQIFEDDFSQTATSSTEVVRQRDFWATIYNMGKIIVKKEGNLPPEGAGYYSTYANLDEKPLENLWAHRDENVTISCQDGKCVVSSPKNAQLSCEGDTCVLVSPPPEDNRGDFTKFGTPVDAQPIQLPGYLGSSISDNEEDNNEGDDTGGNEGGDDNNGGSNGGSDEGGSDGEDDPVIDPIIGPTSFALSKTNTMRINDGMRYVSELGGSFEADGIHLQGDVVAGKTIVQGSNADVYVSDGSGQGAVLGDGDFSQVGLSSESAMFQASYARNQNNLNGADIVMKRKSFYEMIGNTSLATFLERNYALGNNVPFFDQLKSFGSVNSLGQSLDQLSGKGILSRFNFEDMMMMREINFDMNDKLFHNTEDVLVTQGLVKPMAFKGDTGSKAKYSLMYKKHGNISVGLGVSFADIRSDDGHKENKNKEMLYQMNVPIGTKIFGAHLMTSPYLGYARSNYERIGFNNANYKGTIEKRVFGLTNEIRYPIVFGSWTVEPVSEFNILGYNQRGQEDKKAYSLNVESQTSYSVEGGLGVYVSQTTNLAKEGTLRLSSGVVVYHEFADPYLLNVGMNGMQGSFTLRDDAHSQNRAVIRAGFDYKQENLSLYGALTSYIDNEVRTNIKSGMNWTF